MLVIFTLIIVLGLAAFFFVLKKEFKEGPSPAQEEPHLQGFSFGKNLFPHKPAEPPPVKNTTNVVPEREEHKDTKEALVQTLDQKCFKLEQMLDEKNHALADLEADLKTEQSQRQEFDGVRAILQQQIEELKLQNKQLKEEMARILQENLALQSKVYDLAKGAGGSGTIPDIMPDPPVNGPAEDQIVIEPKKVITGGELPKDGLTLNDIFGEDPDNKKE